MKLHDERRTEAIRTGEESLKEFAIKEEVLFEEMKDVVKNLEKK